MNKRWIIIIIMVFAAFPVFSQEGGNSDTTIYITTALVDESGICARIPNVFTPDRDGIDDEWCIKTTGANECTLYLKNSWGSHIIWGEVYETEDNMTTCLWDNGIGNGGTTYPESTYYYTIKLKNTDTGAERIFKGSVDIRLVTWNKAENTGK